MSETKRPSQGPVFGQVDRDQAKDTGMAMVLICLIAFLVTGVRWLTILALVLLLVNMVWPSAYKPLGRLWFGLSHVLGTIASKVLLSVLYFLLVTPVGLLRRLLGKDSLQLKAWKQGRDSVFTRRDHAFTAEDIEHPF
jgi:hypothetical protein